MAVHNMVLLEDSKGSTYELGSTHSYTTKELLEFIANNLNHRPNFVKYSYEDFMKLYMAPKYTHDKGHWFICRPDYVAEMGSDIVAKKRDGIKTFEDLYISPSSPHHWLADWCSWMTEKRAIERYTERTNDEWDADDELHY